MEAVFFYIFATLMLMAAGLVAFHRNPIYSALSLLAMMFALACLFVMLGAYFVAALQILLYAGAVLVLFLFVIMLLNLSPEALGRMRIFTLRGIGTITAVFLFLYLARFILTSTQTVPISNLPPSVGTVESIGRALFSTYLLPFELTSFLILAALIGAVTLARQETSNRK